MPARLAVHLARSPARVWHLEDDRAYRVGRGRGADIPIPDDRVSSEHLILAGSDREWTVRDLGSKNGTLVDGRPVTETTALGETSWLGIGGVMASFRVLTEQAVTSELEGTVERWKSTAALQRLLQPGLGVEALLARLIDSVLELSRTERGFVLVERGDGEMEIGVRRSLEVEDLRDEGFSGSAAAVDRALADRRVVVISDVSEDSELAQRPSVVGAAIQTLIALPLLVGDDLLGVIYADSRNPGAAITELDVEILEALSRQAALALRLARLDSDLESVAARLSARLADEPELAARIARELDEVSGRDGTAKHRDETPPTPPPSPGGGDTWRGVLAAHAGISR